MPRPHMLTHQSQTLRMQSTNALNLSVSSLVVAKETLMGNKGDMMGCQWSYAVYIIPEHDLLLACLHCQTYSTTATTPLGSILTCLLFTV